MSLALETAQSHWREIRPQPGRSPHPLESKILSHWVATDVCRVVDELARRADFRELARAPIDHLCRGPQTPEGRLIDQIDSALVETARNLVGHLQRIAAREDFVEWNSNNPVPSPHQVTVRESGVISAQGYHVIERVRHVEQPVRETSEIESLIAGIGYIARRPWIALTSVNDYFGSSARLNLTSEELERERIFYGGQPPEISDFSPIVQPGLDIPADFIFDCFERRVQYWRGALDRFYVRISRLVHQCPVITEDDRQAFREAICSVRPFLDELRRLWQESVNAAERQAAIQLVQIRAAFHPERSLDWLSEASPFLGNAIVYRDRLERRGKSHIAVTIADALSTLSEMYHRQEDVGSQIRCHAQTHSLCVIEGRGRREVYWQGDLLEVDWNRHERAWILFANLAEHAKLTGQGVDSMMMDEKFSIRDAKTDLQRLLPGTLSNLILGKPRTALRLDLSSSEIYYGFFSQQERLEPLSARMGLPARAT